MDWEINGLENELRASEFFNEHGFIYAERVTRKPGTDLELHLFRFANGATDRSIEVTFFPARSTGIPVSTFHLVQSSTDEGFDLRDYLKQHHGLDIALKHFQYTNYSGDAKERLKGILDYITPFMDKYALPILRGHEWPKVEFDWRGHK